MSIHEQLVVVNNAWWTAIGMSVLSLAAGWWSHEKFQKTYRKERLSKKARMFRALTIVSALSIFACAILAAAAQSAKEVIKIQIAEGVK